MREGPNQRCRPERVSLIPETKQVLSIAAGGGGVEGGHSVFHVRDVETGGEELWACGHGRWGQLGLRSYNYQSDPKALGALAKLREWDEASGKVVGIRVAALASVSATPPPY